MPTLYIAASTNSTGEDAQIESNPLTGFEYAFERDVNRRGEVVSNGLRGGEIIVRHQEFPSRGLLRWFFDRTRALAGRITLPDGTSRRERTELSFSAARPVAYALHYDACRSGAECLTGQITIRAKKIETENDINCEKRNG